MPWLIIKEFDNIKGEAWDEIELDKKKCGKPIKEGILHRGYHPLRKSGKSIK